MPVLELLVAYLLDLMIGDPRWLPHPVQGIGRLIRDLEPPLRRYFPHERTAGTLLVLLVIGITVGTVCLTLWAAALAGPWCGSTVSVVWLYFGLATRSLWSHTRQIDRDLARGDLAAARRSVSRIVGRDTANLNSSEVSRATVESIAESTVDGILAPLFFIALGGAPLLWLFKAASTCDSMIGYRNERYIRFGTFGARLDDVLNYLPARLGFLLFPIAAFTAGESPRACWLIARRDHTHHDSPNAGIPEAAMAGALQIRLGGPTVYDGEVAHKEFFGAEFRIPEPHDISRALRIMLLTSLLSCLMACTYMWFC